MDRFLKLSDFAIDITYANLAAAIGSSSLIKGARYRITDFHTVHAIANSSPALTNTGPTEPLTVQALTANTLCETAFSEQFPMDTIYYNFTNNASSVTGYITRRIDNITNVDVNNDFRNVKYRRYKLNPAVWNSGTAYTYLQVVLYSDGAIYACGNQSGVSAGDIPGYNSNNWIQLFPNNNYYLAPTTANMVFPQAGGNNLPSPGSISIPVDATNFVDAPMFQGYDTTNTSLPYLNLKINGSPGAVNNGFVVYYAATGRPTAKVFVNSVIGYPGGALNSTLVADYNYFNGINIGRGMQGSVLWATAGGGSANTGFQVFNTTGLILNSIIACYSSSQVNIHNITYSVIRGLFSDTRVNGDLRYVITPCKVLDLFVTGHLSNIKFLSNAWLQSTYFLNGLSEYNSNSAVDSTAGVLVSNPLNGRTFIGAIGIVDNYYQAGLMQSAINRAATRHIIFLTPDQPSEKTTVKITSGSPLVVTWQTDLVPYLSDNSYASIGISGAHNDQVGAIATYASKHGNDFDVSQKDLIAGVWTPNNSPTYTIDAVDGSGNVTQVTFTPNPSATESRFIIV